MIIQAETFKALQEDDSRFSEGTVDVNFGGETKTVSAFKFEERIIARGFGGRYQTSGKVWPATVTLNVKTGHEYADFGRDDRSGRFNKVRGIFLL